MHSRAGPPPSMDAAGSKGGEFETKAAQLKDWPADASRGHGGAVARTHGVNRPLGVAVATHAPTP
jgi:hypothetical protein